MTKTPTKVVFIDKTGEVRATAVTTRPDKKFALIGNFKQQGYRVISIHVREDLADPASVFNCHYTDVRVAYQA